MLLLTRRCGESIIIGDDIRITVIGVKGNSVKLGIKAPNDLSVHREEIYNKIKACEGTDDNKGNLKIAKN